MIEEVLLNYGVLGLWTIFLLWEKIDFQKKIMDVIKKNTAAINKISKKLC